MLGHKSQEESKEERIIQKFGHSKCFGLKNCLLMRELVIKVFYSQNPKDQSFRKCLISHHEMLLNKLHLAI